MLRFTGQENLRLLIIRAKGPLLRAAAAVATGAVFFLLLPLSYSFSRSRVRSLLAATPQRVHRVETAQLRQKPKVQPKPKEPRRIRSQLDRQQQLQGSRFRLDLSLAGGDGGGAAVTQQDSGVIYRTGQVDTPPVRRRAVMPAYPVRARREGIESSVKLELLIDEHGRIRRIRFLKCLPNWGFEAAVRDALQQWEFAPAKLRDLPVRCWAELTIDFKL